MLKFLAIKDFIIVKYLEIDFSRNFTALTGETGAGKSILIDALSLLMGARADFKLIRNGCNKSIIAAEFCIKNNEIVRNQISDLGFSQDNDLIIRRVFETNGKSRCWINDNLVNLQLLKSIGINLVNINGQHAFQSLMVSESQRKLLDSYCKNKHLVKNVEIAFKNWQDLKDQYEITKNKYQIIEKDKEFLEWKLKELNDLNLSEGEWENLQNKHKKLSNTNKLTELSNKILGVSFNEENSIHKSWLKLQQMVEEIISIDPSLKSVKEATDLIDIQIKEVQREINSFVFNLEENPDDLFGIESRINDIITVSRKYKENPELLYQLKFDVEKQFNTLINSTNLDKIFESVNEAKEAYEKLANELTSCRKNYAIEMEEKVTKLFSSLDINDGKFEIHLKSLDAGKIYGKEKIEFRVATHENTPTKLISEIASGGELSRISLAIQFVNIESISVPTLIFDEVDSGIGGRVSEIIGKLLREVGKVNQVLCVTHLAQVASAANNQIRVIKDHVKEPVQTKVQVLDGKLRIDEISRMIGGINITDATRIHAAEMLDQYES